MRFTKELKVGLLITTTLITIYLGLNYLKGKEIFPSTNIYYTLYEDAKGLSQANEVRLNGFKVGRIQKVDILPNENYKVLITLAIDKNIKVTNTSIAKLESNNLLGNKIISLILNNGPELQPYDTLISVCEPDFQTKFEESTLPTLNDARSLTLLTNKFMQNLVENAGRINTIFNNLEKISHQLQHVVNTNQKDLSIIGRNMADISLSLSDPELGVKPLLTRLNQLSNEIEFIKINEIFVNLNNILNKIEQGGIYEHLDQTSINLDRLLIDMRIHPDRYVHFSIFGNNSIFSRIKRSPIRKTNNTKQQLPISGENNLP